jgi:Toprim domain
MFPSRSIADLARHLAHHAEAVCRYYLSNGRRQGRYWLVGDVDNAPGRSLYVRLFGPDTGKGAAGKWTDAATGTHGDLLDLIRHNQRLADVYEAAAEARRFLSLPQPPAVPTNRPAAQTDAAKRLAARRLWAMTRPIAGTHAAAYLAERGITDLAGTQGTLRFHPSCFHRSDDGTRSIFPAMIAAVTDEAFSVHGLHRTWLDRSRPIKALIPDPRRAMGMLLGHGVRIGFDRNAPPEVAAAGEGIETVLSVRQALPRMPAIAALSAAHLGALILPATLQRLYIATEADGAARHGLERLADRARAGGIEVEPLRPILGDFNDDLRLNGREALRLALLPQLVAADARFAVDP